MITSLLKNRSTRTLFQSGRTFQSGEEPIKFWRSVLSFFFPPIFFFFLFFHLSIFVFASCVPVPYILLFAYWTWIYSGCRLKDVDNCNIFKVVGREWLVSMWWTFINCGYEKKIAFFHCSILVVEWAFEVEPLASICNFVFLQTFHMNCMSASGVAQYFWY